MFHVKQDIGAQRFAYAFMVVNSIIILGMVAWGFASGKVSQTVEVSVFSFIGLFFLTQLITSIRGLQRLRGMVSNTKEDRKNDLSRTGLSGDWP